MNYVWNLNVDGIKQELGIDALPLQTAVDASGNETGDYKCWNDANRTCVLVNKELATSLKSGAKVFGLGTEVREGPKGKYTLARIFGPEMIL